MLPILRKNGLGVLFCGNWTSEDNKDLEGTLKILKGKIVERKQIFLPKQKGSYISIGAYMHTYCTDAWFAGIYSMSPTVSNTGYVR